MSQGSWWSCIWYLQHFCQTKEYNEIGFLFQMSLDKVGEEKHDLRGLNLHLKGHINDLRASIFVLKKKETLVFSNGRSEFSENQTHYILSGAELKCKLNYLTCSMCTSEIKALLGREWYESWNNDMWEDFDESGDTKPFKFWRDFYASKSNIHLRLILHYLKKLY